MNNTIINLPKLSILLKPTTSEASRIKISVNSLDLRDFSSGLSRIT